MSAKRVGRLLRSEGLRGERARRFVMPVAVREVSTCLTACAVGSLSPRCPRVWVADATACWTGEGWLC